VWIRRAIDPCIPPSVLDKRIIKSKPGSSVSGVRAPVTLDMKLYGPQNRFGGSREKKNMCPYRKGSPDSPVIQPMA